MNIPVWPEEMWQQLTDAQQQYWQMMASVGAMNQQTEGQQLPDWAGMVKQWQQSFSAGVPVDASEVARRMTDAAHSFTAFAESVMAHQEGPQADMVSQWLQAMETACQHWAEQVQHFGDKAKPAATAQQLWENWQQLLSGVGVGQQAMPAAMGFVPGFAPGMDWSKLMPAMPDGLSESVNQVMTHYQQAMQKYIEALSLQGLDSVQQLREKLSQLAVEGGSVDSVRELYNLWVDVNEEVYAKFTQSQDYQTLYAELVNAFSALQEGMAQFREAQFENLNLVMRRDLDEVLEQQQKLEAIHQQLVAELAQTREQLADVQAQLAEVMVQPQSAITVPEAVVETPVEVVAQPGMNDPDDLTRIKGLGPKMSEKLLDAGIQTFEQLATLSSDQAKALDKTLDARGRLLRDDWVGQAAKLSGTRLA